MKLNHVLAVTCLFGLCLLNAPGQLMAQDAASATISVELQFEPDFPGSGNIQLFCSFGDPRQQERTLETGSPLELPLSGFSPSGGTCQLRAIPVPGYTPIYEVSGGAAYRADKNGCQFTRFENGQANMCRVLLRQDPVTLTVYKKWIGGSGEEPAVQISLECESGEYTGFRYINEGSPAGWQISGVHPDGILCNVSETVLETYRPDIIDCQGLYILPGRGEECTMVNTKIVKRIEMLNRYGKVVMIVLVLVIGLVAMKRFS